LSRIQRRFQLGGLEPDTLAHRLRGLGWKVQDGPDRVEARQGSQVTTRLLGGWFVNADKLPKRLVSQRAERAMTIIVEETMGFGFMDPKLRRKYEETFAALERQLSDRVM